MLNIAMLSYHTCPLAVLGGKDTGGMNVYVRELTRKLGENGIHVDVFTRSQDDHVPHVLHDLGYGCRVVHIPAGPEVPLPKKALIQYVPEFVEGIRQFAAEKGLRYDLIHSHYWLSGLAARQLQEGWDVPFIQMFHTLGEMKNRIARSPEEMDPPERIAAEKDIILWSEQVIAATVAEQAQLEFLYRTETDKITVIPPGVDPARFYPIPKDEARQAIQVPADDRLILFVGRIEPLKGVDTLLKAMSILKTSGVQCELPHDLVIIGGDPTSQEAELSNEMRRLKTFSEQNGLQNMVLFLGKRGQDTLPYYYSAAEMVVMPSHYESFGMVALEAMACGTPVVASQVGGLAFLVRDGETGFVIPDGDADALADRLFRLMVDEELRKKMGEKAAAYAQAYHWGEIARQIEAVYAKVLSSWPIKKESPAPSG